MSWIQIVFTPVEDVVDIVGVLEHAGFPLRGPKERYYVLHEGSVGHLNDSRATSRVVVGAPTSELMMWFYDHHDACVACTVTTAPATEHTPDRVTVRLNLDGASDADVLFAADAVARLLEFLVDPEIDATVPVGR